MKAMLTTRHGDRSVLCLDENFPDPVAKAGEVVINVYATSVNFHDIFTRRGMPGIKIPLPLIVGSDIAGTVAEVGAGVDQGWLDKSVLVDPELRAEAGEKYGGMVGETCHGGRAEKAAIPVGQLLEIPDGVSLAQATTLPLAYGTAWHMLITNGKLAKGETVLVLGASGGVGVACVQIAKMLGAKVIACASSDEKIQRLVGIGADHVVNYSETPFREAVHEIVGKPRVTGSGGVDMAINFTGGDTMVDTQKCVRLQGRIVTCGATAGYEVQIDARYLWTYEHQIIGSNGWLMSELRELMDVIAQGLLDPVVDRVLPLEQTAEAERLIEERAVVGKVLIKL